MSNLLYKFVKKDGNVVAVGGENIEELGPKVQEYLNNGYEVSSYEEAVAQQIAADKAAAEAAKVEEKTTTTEGGAETTEQAAA